MRMYRLLALAAMGTIAFSATAFGQIPSVGPGRCVGGCGGASSGGGRGGFGGGGAAGIGSAIGLGMSIGSAIVQQQQQRQKSEEPRARQGARRPPAREADEGRKATAEKSRGRSKTEEAKRPPEKPTKPDKPTAAAKQPSPDTKQAKLTEQPSKGSNWSGCTGKVGTTWNAGNCGQPTMPTSSTQGSSQRSGPSQLPFAVSRLDPTLAAKLICTEGLEQKDTFYGGTRCVPTIADAVVDAPKPPPIDRPVEDSTRTYGKPIPRGDLTATFPSAEYPWVSDPTESKLAECIAAVRPSGPSNASPKCAAAHRKLYNNLQNALKTSKPETTLHDFVEDQFDEFTEAIDNEMTDPAGDNWCWLGSWLDRDVGHCLNRSYSRYELSKY